LKAVSQKLIVADTGPLIALAVMDLLPVLTQLFEKVLVPEAVINECLNDLSKAQSVKINTALSDKLIILEKAIDKEYCVLLEELLDKGEAEAISLAKQYDATVLLDEKSGRNIARKEGLKVVGSLFILIRAKQAEYITSVIPLLEKLKQHGYYLSESLINKVLEVCEEKA